MIWHATTDEAIAQCFPVMRELRTHLANEGAFIEQVRRQAAHGYRLTAVAVGNEVRAVAGWRISENLAWGRFMYVDDLVTSDPERSRGHGGVLLDWLIEEARREGCAEFHLDSGVQRFAAHRFYLKHRMNITSHHFGLVL
jgi:GNAT superfamily N-acetyltransferase